MPKPFLFPSALPRALRSASMLLVLAFAAACDGGGSEPEPNPVPVIEELTPPYVVRGGAEQVVTIEGSGFAETSVARFNGAARETEFVSATRLRARLTAADLATPRFNAITVVTPAPGGGTSNAVEFGVVYPHPEVTSVSPATVERALAGVTVTIHGSGFIPQTRARINEQPRQLTLVSPTEVRVAVTGADLAQNTVLILLENPEPGGGVSVAQVAVVNPAPTLTALSPAVVASGSANTVITLQGSGLVGWTRVFVGGFERIPQYVSWVEMRVMLSEAELATAGTIPIYVQTSGPGGGTSATRMLEVRAPVPVVTGLVDASVVAGTPEMTIYVNGTGFDGNAQVRFDGSPRPTQTRTSTQVQATLSAADLATAGTHQITVFNPAPGGGLSNATTFTVSNPAPEVDGLWTDNDRMGSAGATLTITGRGFLPGSRVVVRPYPPLDRPTTERVPAFISPTELRVAMTAADLAEQGAQGIRVRNPLPGGGTSGEGVFVVTAPRPVLASLDPAFTSDGQTSFTLRVNGSAFAPSSVVEVGGRARQTRYVSPTRLEATLTAGDVGLAWVHEITVRTPEPGGGLSDGRPFEVRAPVPAITALTPTQTAAGQDYFVVEVTGTGFRGSSKVLLNGVPLNTVYRSATRIEGHLQSSNLATVRTVNLAVANEGPGGGVSSAVPFQIVAP